MASIPRGTFATGGAGIGGGRVPKPPKPKAPKAIRPKPIDPNQQANANAMTAFRTALNQLNQSTPPVDSAAIYAPYRASEQITGQLGQGYQQHVLDSGAAAQQQYGNALGQAQQQAAQFGISAGAGANPTALANTGAQPLAQQTNAYAAAAPAAAAQWQALLERTAGAKVADANLQRDQGLTQAKQALSTALPGAIGDEKTRLFQQHVQRFNEGVTKTQLSDKQNAALRDYDLGVAKVQQSGAVASTRAAQNAASINERKRHDLATEQTQQASVALRARSKAATDKGLKGIPAAVKALSGTTSGGSTKKAAKGWDVTVAVMDPDTGEPTGDTKVLRLPDKRKIPKGFKYVSAETHYATVPNTPGKTGITPSQWDAQMRGLLAQNPGQASAIKAFLGPRPKK